MRDHIDLTEPIKSFGKSAVIEAAVGVSCSIAHIPCLIMTVEVNKDLLRKEIELIDTVINNKKQENRDDSNTFSTILSYLFNTITDQQRKEIANKIGIKFSEFVSGRNFSKYYAKIIAEEASKSMMSEGSSLVFDWSSKFIMDGNL